MRLDRHDCELALTLQPANVAYTQRYTNGFGTPIVADEHRPAVHAGIDLS